MLKKYLLKQKIGLPQCESPTLFTIGYRLFGYRFTTFRYLFTNGFVTAPLSVVTRTKYMPAARPETLIWVDTGE